MMIRYLTVLIILLGVPFAAAFYHYMPQSDYVVKTPITHYELKGNHIQYQTSFNEISSRNLVKPFTSDTTRVDIHVMNGPNDSAYPYIIMTQGTNSTADIQTDAFYLNGRIVQKSDERFDIEYDVESLRLPERIVARLSESKPASFKAVWHVRKNGHTRLAGFEINKKAYPYQFKLKDVLVGLTQNRARIIPTI